jgi:PAS domain S-box-containing protein
MDDDKKLLVEKASYRTRPPDQKVLNQRNIVPLGTGIVGNVAKTGKSMIVNDTSESDLYVPEEEVRLSEIAVPIIAKGEVIGVIDSEHPEKNFFTEFHLNILQSIASLCSNKIIQAMDQEKIIHSEERYRTFIENSNDGIIRFEFKEDIDTSADIETQIKLFNKNIYIAECNRAFAKMYDESDPSKLIGKKPDELKYVNVSPEERTIQFIINDYKLYEKEVVESDKYGNLKYFLLNGTGVIKNGKLVRIWGVQRDITEKKKAEEAIKRSLTEKDILLKEIHHRVKNNLQIVTSLLKLQSSYVDDEKVRQLFRESQNRVQSMALIHQKLYLTKDLSHIKLNDYLNNIILHLQHSYGILEDRVQIVIDDKDISISLDNAVPCGLIINELVSNSLKYAFPGNRKGSIFIDTAYDDITGRYWLSVRDDGIGLPDELHPRHTNTFGLRLVSTLVEQMDGNLEVITGSGTEYRITFVSSEYKERSRIN